MHTSNDEHTVTNETHTQKAKENNVCYFFKINRKVDLTH